MWRKFRRKIGWRNTFGKIWIHRKTVRQEFDKRAGGEEEGASLKTKRSVLYYIDGSGECSGNLGTELIFPVELDAGAAVGGFQQ